MNNLYNLLPERISNEEAYSLVNFFMSLALELEFHYFDQIRHCTNEDLADSEYLRQNDRDDESPF